MSAADDRERNLKSAVLVTYDDAGGVAPKQLAADTAAALVRGVEAHIGLAADETCVVRRLCERARDTWG
jgi:hypothetical protein